MSADFLNTCLIAATAPIAAPTATIEFGLKPIFININLKMISNRKIKQEYPVGMTLNN